MRKIKRNKNKELQKMDLRILQSFRDGGLSEASESSEAWVGVVEADGDGALGIAFLFSLQTNRKRATDSVT